MRRVWMLVAVVALAAAALSACFGGDDGDGAAPPPTGQDAVSTPDAGDTSQPSTPDTQADDAVTPDASTPDADAPNADAPDGGETDGGEPAEPVDAGEPAEPVDAEPADGADAGDGEEDAPPPGVPGVTGAALFPQPDPSVRTDTLPARPADFADYPSALLPWLQGRFLIADLIPLGAEWGLPAVAREGDRWHLVDTNADSSGAGDGLSSTVLVLTDPATLGEAMVGSNLVIYDPLPDQPGVFRLVYDHNALKSLKGEPAESLDIVVLSVEDATGDTIRDVTFEETVCGDAGCAPVRWVLVSEGEGYRVQAVE